jgi:signal transduction histidine kinase
MTVMDYWNYMKSNLLGRLGLGFAVALILLGANAMVAHQSVKSLINAERWVTHTYEILREVETDVSLAKDVETGARGYVITANREFLEPYNAARLKVKNKLEPLYTMTRDNPPQQKRVLQLAELIDRKLRASKRQIDLIDAGRRSDAVALVASGEGKVVMDAVRAKAGEMRQVEEDALKERKVLLFKAGRRANITIWLSMGFSLLMMSLIFSGMAQAKMQSQELAVALSELKRLEAMRDSLNAMLVHDLRTPLTTILGPLEMLQAEHFGQLQDTQREIVGMSLLSSRRLLGLVNELLDISKMEAGEMKVRRESLNPLVVVDEATKHIALAEYDGAARIEREVPDNPQLLQADQELLTRVLINLLGNAIKFTPAKGKITLGLRDCVPLEVLPARVKAQLSPTDAERLRLRSMLFCVRDTGEGIPAEDLDRIFDKFGQVESRGAGLKMSTGLGLTFCKLAVEAHGGIIWVESEVGKGSTFYFTIPLRSVAADKEEVKTSEAAAALD